MKKPFKNIIAVLLGLFLAIGSEAQQKQVDTTYLDPTIDIEELLPPLDSLMVVGLRNNPLQRLEQSQANSYYWTMQYTKKLWTQGLGVFFNYSTGNLPFFAFNTGAGVSTSTNVLYDGYRAGIDLRLSVFDLIGYRGRVNSARELWEVAKHKKDVEALTFRQAVADLYTNMVGWQKIFKARNEDLFVQQVACQVAEKEFREGTVHIAEYARQKNILAIAVAAKEDAQKYYINFYERLQSLIGVKLSSLRRAQGQ